MIIRQPKNPKGIDQEIMADQPFSPPPNGKPPSDSQGFFIAGKKLRETNGVHKL